MTPSEALATLAGLQLASVEFVRDYLQLRFDGPVLSLYTFPTIVIGRMLQRSDLGYCDALVALISQPIEAVSLTPEAIEIAFKSGSSLRVSLRDEDYTTEEAALLEGVGDAIWSF